MMIDKKDDKGWVNVDEDVDKPNDKGKKAGFEFDGKYYDPYAMNKSQKLPLWLKACFMKWWLPGAVFYFISFGIEGLLQGYTYALILGLVWGCATDVLLNHFLRELSSDGLDYTKYIFCGRKKSVSGLKRFLTLPINLVYGIFVCVCTGFTVNPLLSGLKNPDEVMFYIGPLLFATVVMMFDVGFAMLRNLLQFLFRKRKKDNEAND